jgi:hypothetical protein
MADIVLDAESVPTTPSAGQGNIFVDTTGKILCFKSDGGIVSGYTKNAAIAAQGAGFASDTYLTNSDILIPSFGMQAKSTFRWTVSASKTGAGIATPIYVIRLGTGRATSDAAVLTLTGPAQTAVADIGTLSILVTCRSVSGAGVIQGTAWWTHRGTVANTTTSGTGFASDTTGHVEGTSAGFDNTAATIAGKYLGLSINGGGSASWTLTQVLAEGDW